MYQDKEYLKSKLKDYAAANLRKSKYGFYVCPSCRSGEGRKGTGAFSIDEKKQEWTCFSCNNHGDIFNLVEYTQGLHDFKDQYSYIANYYGISQEYKRPGAEKKETPKAIVREVVKEVKAAEPTEEEKKEIQAREKYINDCNLFAAATDYFNNRGLTDNTIDNFKLGYDTEKNMVIIPYNTDNSYYIKRFVDNRSDGLRYIKIPGVQEPIFNQNDIFNKDIIFITEGQIDALSIIQELNNNKVGAIAIGGTGKNKLLNLLKDYNLKCKFIVTMDNDEPGEKAAEGLINDLKDLGLLCVKAVFNYSKYAKNKDCNDLLISNVEQFKSDIQSSINAIYELVEEKEKEERKVIDKYKANNLLQAFKNNVYSNTHTCISTGFNNLDYILDGGLYSGLYFLGACSSLGKTTLLLQLADQIASSGKDVLYFSLEMSQDEIISKSISRYTYLLADDKKQAKTTRGITDIKRYKTYTEQEKELINKSMDKYQREPGEHLYIYESIKKMSVDDIREKIKEHIRLTEQKPIVFIDYLQILAAFNDNASDKRIVDENVTQLKILSRDFNIPIMCISSLNRESYSNYISMQAFKESGSIEYGSDYLLAMQPLGIQQGNTKEIIKDNIECFRKCKKSQERKIQLLVLKNRNGALQDTTFTYYTLFNNFVGDTDFKPINEETKQELKNTSFLDFINN